MPLTGRASALLLALAGLASGAQAQPDTLTLVVNADLGRVTISRHIYGQFAEHLGRGIYTACGRGPGRGHGGCGTTSSKP